MFNVFYLNDCFYRLFFTGTGKQCSLLQFVEFMIMRESNLYEYDLSLLAVSRDRISRFELCQIDETFNVFYLYSIRLNKTFYVDYLARSLPVFTRGKIAQQENTPTKSTREQSRQSAESRVLCLDLLINSGFMFLTVCAWLAKRCHCIYNQYCMMTSQCANCVLRLPILITLAEIESPLS